MVTSTRMIERPWKVRCKGAQDGRTWRLKWGWPPVASKEPYPALNDTSPPEAEEQLYAKTGSLLSTLCSDWYDKDKSLRETCGKAERDGSEAERAIVRVSEELNKTEKDYEEAKCKLEGLERPRLAR